MLLYKDILKEEDPRLRQKSQLVNLPLTNEDIRTIEEANEYLENGYDSKLVEEYNLRPGVGLSAVQIGVLKQFFVVFAYDEEGKLHHYVVINPKIISHSEELVYIRSGEGCLSIDRETEGLVHRYKRITASTHIYDFKTKEVSEVKLKLSDYMAIIFQHEYDHLQGKLFTDRIDKFNPFFIPENSKPIIFENSDETENEGE